VETQGLDSLACRPAWPERNRNLPYPVGQLKRGSDGQPEGWLAQRTPSRRRWNWPESLRERSARPDVFCSRGEIDSGPGQVHSRHTGPGLAAGRTSRNGWVLPGPGGADMIEACRWSGCGGFSSVGYTWWPNRALRLRLGEVYLPGLAGGASIQPGIGGHRRSLHPTGHLLEIHLPPADLRLDSASHMGLWRAS